MEKRLRPCHSYFYQFDVNKITYFSSSNTNTQNLALQEITTSTDDVSYKKLVIYSEKNTSEKRKQTGDKY